MSVERIPNGALKLTSRGGAALYVSSIGDAPVIRIGAMHRDGGQLVLVDLDEHDVEDLRDELDAWLASQSRAADGTTLLAEEAP